MTERAANAEDHPELARAWLAAAVDPAASAELEAIYEMVSNQIAARGPACWASGRCCNFRASGHRLYVTGLEAAYMLTRLAPEQRLTEGRVADAVERGDCPMLAGNMCSVHTIKPLGCRVYFCDRSAQHWQQELSERALNQIRGLHDRHAIEYRYAEWRGLLAMLVAAQE